ncbi:hypothetical protein Tco_1106405 [Tanacetum coccineum]
MAALSLLRLIIWFIILEKPNEVLDLKQIEDFLNAHTIKYALTINPTIYTSCIEQFWATAKTSVRRDPHLEDVEGTECLPTATIFDELTRMGSKTTAWNEFSSTMASAIICLATNQKFNFSKYIINNMVKNVDSMVKFWMYPSGPTELIADEAANEENKVLDLETSKTTQALEIESLKRRVKKLEKKQRSRTHKLRRLYKGRKILDIDADEDITLDSTHFDTDPDMFGVHDLHGDEVFVETEELVVNAATTTTTTATTTVADEVKGQGSKDKGKAKMIEPEKPLKKKDQVLLDEQEAIKLQAQFDEEARIAREKKKPMLPYNEKGEHLSGDELEQEKAKKQKIDDNQKEAKMKEFMEVVSDEEGVAIDAIPLSTKPPSIVDYKIIKEGKINIYQIIRADGSLKRYSAIIHMLKKFDREYLETLWKIVKARHGYTRPEEGYERVLWGDLKTMFEHHIEDLM